MSLLEDNKMHDVYEFVKQLIRTSSIAKATESSILDKLPEEIKDLITRRITSITKLDKNTILIILEKDTSK